MQKKALHVFNDKEGLQLNYSPHATLNFVNVNVQQEFRSAFFDFIIDEVIYYRQSINYIS